MRFLLELEGSEETAGTGQRVTTQQIAKNQGLSEKYLESIAARLKKHGFVCAAKGQNGGYWLAKPINEITVGDVMRAMETSRRDAHCVTEPSKCPNNEDCALEFYWESLESTVERAADAMTLDRVTKAIAE